MLVVLLLVVAYLLGSLSSAVWISKRFYGIDIREHGSKNAGATNMLRVLGRKAALPVFAIDFTKGLLAVMLSRIVEFDAGEPMFYLRMALLVAVVLGHIFPVFAGFKGGKGVATIAGAMMGIYPPAVLLCLLTFLVVLALTHYVSLSSMTAGVAFPIYAVFVFKQTEPPIIILGCVVALMLIYTHRKNIRRLINGTESKIYLLSRHSSGDVK